jgi:hypothetical protein
MVKGGYEAVTHKFNVGDRVVTSDGKAGAVGVRIWFRREEGKPGYALVLDDAPIGQIHEVSEAETFTPAEYAERSHGPGATNNLSVKERLLAVAQSLKEVAEAIR